MNKKKKLERFEQIVQGAIEVFKKNGYRRTQIADIAEKLGYAYGTVYNYFKSKEALFDFIIRNEILDLSPEEWPDIPVPNPEPGSTFKFLISEMNKGEIFKLLREALVRRECPNPRQELEDIIRDLYTDISDHQNLILLLNQSSMDWPELAEVYDKYYRQQLKRWLKQFLDMRISLNHFRKVPHTQASVRLITELITWFAIERHYSTDAAKISDKAAEETLVDAILQIFIPRAK